jgi:hypothetical protein
VGGAAVLHFGHPPAAGIIDVFGQAVGIADRGLAVEDVVGINAVRVGQDKVKPPAYSSRLRTKVERR